MLAALPPLLGEVPHGVLGVADVHHMMAAGPEGAGGHVENFQVFLVTLQITDGPVRHAEYHIELAFKADVADVHAVERGREALCAGGFGCVRHVGGGQVDPHHGVAAPRQRQRVAAKAARQIQHPLLPRKAQRTRDKVHLRLRLLHPALVFDIQ
ncbi:hypothetical protein SDC9_179411 [bioreactor metagenome]|uniref:Uncharacterized protein n=1 Tax=bioreactor metagenome TaxID=1076179 RepID=A0A645H0D4_9ZZZZ